MDYVLEGKVSRRSVTRKGVPGSPDLQIGPHRPSPGLGRCCNSLATDDIPAPGVEATDWGPVQYTPKEVSGQLSLLSDLESLDANSSVQFGLQFEVEGPRHKATFSRTKEK